MKNIIYIIIQTTILKKIFYVSLRRYLHLNLNFFFIVCYRNFIFFVKNVDVIKL